MSIWICGKSIIYLFNTVLICRTYIKKILVLYHFRLEGKIPLAEDKSFRPESTKSKTWYLAIRTLFTIISTFIDNVIVSNIIPSLNNIKWTGQLSCLLYHYTRFKNTISYQQFIINTSWFLIYRKYWCWPHVFIGNFKLKVRMKTGCIISGRLVEIEWK